MELLSEDDLNLKDMTPEELDKAWDLWFDLAQTTNAASFCSASFGTELGVTARTGF